jgi:hypothetical protein
MKKIQLVLIVLISIVTFAQAPESMSYQAVVRDVNDALITNQIVGMQLSILKSGGGDVYIETQTPMTNANGLVTLEIGTGTIQFGSFTDIPWDSASLDIKVETDLAGGTNYTITGQSQLVSVPYALYAKSSGDDHSKIFDTDGDTQIQTEESPNEDIIRFDLAGTAKWVMKNNALEQLNSGESLFIGQDAGANDDLSSNKNVFLGFGSGFSNTSGEKNIAVGHNSLVFNSNGTENIAMGYQSLFNNTTGNNNIGIGSESIFTNTIGDNNIAIGQKSLFENSSGNKNIAIGDRSLNLNISGDKNIAIGYESLKNNPVGNNNIAIGYESQFQSKGDFNVSVGVQTLFGNNVDFGSQNTAMGFQALYRNTSGDNNTAIGYESSQDNFDGIDNTSIGSKSLSSNQFGNRNTAIGKEALFNTIGDNNIGIGFQAEVPNSSADNQVRIGNTNINYAGIQVAWSITSDKFWKENIQELSYGLDFVKQLKPVDYTRKNNKDKTREIGFIAQDIEALLNKVNYTNQGIITTDSNGRLSVRYNDFIPILTKAIQEQQEDLENKENQIQDLQNQINQLKVLIENK